MKFSKSRFYWLSAGSIYHRKQKEHQFRSIISIKFSRSSICITFAIKSLAKKVNLPINGSKSVKHSFSINSMLVQVYIKPGKSGQDLVATMLETLHKKMFSTKDFSSKCDQICSFLLIWSHLLNKSLIENFIFYAVKRCFGEGKVIKQNSTVSAFA